LVWQLIAKNSIQQCHVHADATVVVDEAELPEAIHEKADARPRSADHGRKRLLRDAGKQHISLTLIAKFRHQQEGTRQAPFAGVEELIDQIFLGANASKNDELHEEIGKRMLLMQSVFHLLRRDAKHPTGSNGGGRGGSKRTLSRHRFFAKEISGSEERHCGFFPLLGNNGEFGSASLKVIHGVSWAPLKEEDLPWLKVGDGSADADR
jgi:hypothetical protein